MSKTKPKTQLPLPVAMRVAADFIETHPERYKYMKIEVPATESDCGCMAGWTFFFQGRFKGDFPSLKAYCTEWRPIDCSRQMERLGCLEACNLPSVAARYLRIRADELETIYA